MVKKVDKKDISRKFLILVLFLAAFLRLFKISSVPPSLSWDEAAIGYDAYSILQTGRDQWGNFMPLAFKSFGEYKYPFHIYATAFFEKIFGVNELAVRFGSAFFGVINILLLYILVKNIFRNRKIAILSSFFLAISPWHIQFSRISWETNYALFFFLLGFIFFLKWIKKKHFILLVISSVLFGLDIFTYNAAKVFIPLFLLSLGLIYRQEFIKDKLKTLVFVGIFVSFLSFNLLNPKLSGLARYSQLSFEMPRVVSTFSYQTTHIYKLGCMELVVRQYLSHFSPKFLFISGDPNPRHSIQSFGELFVYDILFIPLGIWYLLKYKNKNKYLLLAWFFLWPVPASIAREYPHASRAMFSLGILQITSSLGIVYLWQKIKGRINIKLYIALVGSLIMLFLFRYLNSYFNVYSKRYSQSWQYGYKQIGQFVQENYSKYDKIYITRAYGEPQIFLLFYLHYSPKKYQFGQEVVRKRVGDWIKVSAFDKFIFLDKEEFKSNYLDMSKNKNEKLLFIGVLGDFPKEDGELLGINFLDGSSAFLIVDNL